MANPTWFEIDPKLAWGFYGHRLKLYESTTPHRGYNMLLEMASNTPNGYFVFTSNVDGHFFKSGYDRHRVVARAVVKLGVQKPTILPVKQLTVDCFSRCSHLNEL